MIVSPDTNILVYAVDDRDAPKQAIAREVLLALSRRGSPVALQVVGEFQNALHRRLRCPVSYASQQARNVFTAFDTFSYGEQAVDTALAYSAAGRMSYWDALLLGSCSESGIDVLLSEDMQDGGRLGGVEIVNPFGAGGLSERAREVLELR